MIAASGAVFILARSAQPHDVAAAADRRNSGSRTEFVRQHVPPQIRDEPDPVRHLPRCRSGAGPAFAQTTVVTETTPTVTEVQIGPATSGGGAGGSASGAIAGAAVGGSVGAVVGGVAGAVVGDVTEDALTPATRAYVLEHRTASVDIDGDVAVGTPMPEAVQIQAIPDSPYSHVHVGERPVLVDPQSRRIVHDYE